MTALGLALSLLLASPRSEAAEYPAPPTSMPRLTLDASAPDASTWENGFREVYDRLKKNLHERRDGGPRFAQPAPKYPGVYLWDSAFIADIWRNVDPGVAKQVLLSVLLNQKKDGRVPQVKSVLGSSGLSNPPLLSWEAMRIHRQSPDAEFLADVYEPLKRFHAWYFANRRRPDGLFFWKHPYESGLDNSPRFSNRKESRFDDTTKIAAIDLSSYLVLDSENMAAMALALGKAEDAEAFQKDGRELKDAINARLWDEASKMYFDRRDNGDFVRVLSIAALTPLVAGVPTPERAAAVVARIEDPAEFNTPTPFPSVARSDPQFQKDCWRGPVWVNMAYLAILGMERYGYGAQAKEMARRLVDGVYKTKENTGKFVEYYDPERNDFQELTRKKGNLYKRLTLGSKPVAGFVGWTGLVNNLAIEQLGLPISR